MPNIIPEIKLAVKNLTYLSVPLKTSYKVPKKYPLKIFLQIISSAYAENKVINT